MVKTNIIKTKKKLEKLASFFCFFFYKIRGPFWDTHLKFFFLANKKKFMKYMNAFIKHFLHNYKNILWKSFVIICNYL